jgi:hypothetical protein
MFTVPNRYYRATQLQVGLALTCELKFNLLFWFVYFHIYFKTSAETETSAKFMGKYFHVF